MLDKIENDEAVVICVKALNNWGVAIQQVVAMEEMGELIQAISKAIRCKQNNVEEEIADVETMLMQLRLIFNNQKVEEIKQAKLKRLKELVW
jgi:NTP pyrophosphatase (non-canonical NTP hydrolase)